MRRSLGSPSVDVCVCRHYPDCCFKHLVQTEPAGEHESSNGPTQSIADAPALSDSEDRAPVAAKKFECQETAVNRVVYLDLDNFNYHRFFQKLGCFPEQVRVHGFLGGGSEWKRPDNAQNFSDLESRNMWELHESLDGADFAVVLQMGKDCMNYPKEVSFTVISGNKRFEQLAMSCSEQGRDIRLVDPHATLESPQTTETDELAVMWSALADSAAEVDEQHSHVVGKVQHPVDATAGPLPQIQAVAHCKQCTKRFRNDTFLAKHIRRKHTPVDSLPVAPEGSVAEQQPAAKVAEHVHTS